MEEQVNRIEELTRSNSQSIKEIRDLLTVDEFGREGILQKQSKNHERLSRLELQYKKVTWLGGLGTGLLALLITFKEEIKTFFFEK